MSSSSYENYDPCFPDQPVVDLYLPIWAKLPAFRSKPAFVWADDTPQATTWSSVTYSQLDSSVQSIASGLLHPALGRGDTVLILCPPGLRLLKTIFACQRAGLIAVPIIPPHPGKFSSPNQTPAHPHLLRAIAQAQPKAVIAYSRYISTVTQTISTGRLGQLMLNLRWLSVEELEDQQHNMIKICCPKLSCTNAEHYSGCKPDEPYLLQYTSGATGIPKPVVVTAGAAAHNVREARKAYDLQPGSVIVSWLPQYHDCGLMFLLLTVVAGATCVLTSPAAFLNRPRLWLELVTEFHGTCSPVPSFALPLVARRGGVHRGKLPLKLGSLRNLVLINEPLYKSFVDEFIDQFACVGLNPSSISPSYGLAENCTFVSTAWRWRSSNYNVVPSYKKLLPSGMLSSSPDFLDGEIEILVVNESSCEPVEDGVEGEVWVSSPSNASGYLDHPSLTRETFHGRLRGRAGPCYVRTGDRGVVTGEERYLYIVGRCSDVVEVGGQAVHPHYMETAACNSSPMLLRAGCVAAFQIEGEVVMVAELRKGGEAMSTEGICEGIRDGVWKEEGVEVGTVALVESGSVPKTTSGKLQRWAAKDKLLQGKFPVLYMVQFDQTRQHESISDDASTAYASAAGHRRSLLSFL